MSLLDKLKTDLSSFDYSKIGQKHDDYFGEDNATGFTPNRQEGDKTEFIPKSTNKLENFPGPVDFVQPNYNPLEKQSILTSETKTMSGITFNGEFSSDWLRPNYNPLKDQSILTSERVQMSFSTQLLTF